MANYDDADVENGVAVAAVVDEKKKKKKKQIGKAENSYLKS